MRARGKLAVTLPVVILVALQLAWLPAPALAYQVRDGGRSGWPPPWVPGTDPLPVLLVSAPGVDPEAVWGGEAGLRARLERAGYRVWTADLSAEDDPDPERLARLRVGPAAEAAMDACGAGRLHVIAHGAGALAARYWAEHGGRGRVATLVMIGPPNHGSFAMNVLHLAAALSAPEAGRSEDGVPGGAGALPAAGPWDYIRAKAASEYRPLYRRYVQEYRLGVPPGDVLEGVRRLAGRLPFEGWLAREEPALFARDLVEAQSPLPGSSVTLAYAHAAALNVARYEELRSTLRGPDLLSSVLDDPLLTADWGEMLRHYGGKVILWAGRQVADWLTRQGQKLLVEQAALLLGVDPYSPGVERLLQETFSLSLGPDPDGRPRRQQLLGNWFLRDWNRGAVRDENCRYVVVAGRAPNLWRLGWKHVGDNDFWVEVESCFLAPAGDDRFAVVEEGGTGASHGRLPRSRRVQQLVLSELRFSARKSLYPRAGNPRTVSWGSSGRIPLASWSPAYLRLDARYLTRPGRLTVELEPRAGTRAGLPLAWAWVGRVDGSWERREAAWDGARAVLEVGGFGQEVDCVLVGGRLPLPAGSGVVAAYRRAAPGDLLYRATLVPFPAEGAGGTAGAAPSGGGPAAAGAGGATASGEGAGAAGGPGQAGGAPGAAAPGPEGGAGSLPQGVPVIRATLPTKLTTHRREQRVRHLRWDWDFGDGTTFVDEDPTHTWVTVEHVFAEPGEYTVRARSTGSDGRVLREKEWRVRVAPPGEGADAGQAPGGGTVTGGGEGEVAAGEAWRATVDTAQEPRVRAVIDAPREWMSGRPAVIRVSVEVEDVPYLVERRVEVDPGEEFVMVWERAGLFPVRVAVTVTLHYRLPETEYTLRNTYLFETWVKVLTTSGTD